MRASYRFKKTGKRNEIFLATKCGFTGNPERLVNGEPDYIKECMGKSLSRLGGTSVSLSGCCFPADTALKWTMWTSTICTGKRDCLSTYNSVTHTQFPAPTQLCLLRAPSGPWPSSSSTLTPLFTPLPKY